MSESSRQAEPQNELSAKLDPRWAFPFRYFAATVLFGILFLYFNFMPLYHVDLWGHVLYGNWILDHGDLPAEDPFVANAAGVQLTLTDWLSQIILAATERRWGAEGLSSLYALASLSALIMTARALFLRTNRLGWSLLFLIIAMFLAWGRLAFFRPETLAFPCFAALLGCVATIERRQLTRSVNGSVARPNCGTKDFAAWLPWIATPVIFGLWANLHGSFAVGIVLLGCWAVGHTVQAKANSRDWEASRRSNSLRQWWLLLLLAIAACLINPYGIRLLIKTVAFSSNPNLEHITEWSRLRFTEFGGIRVLISWIALAILAFFRWRKFTLAEVLAMLVFSLAVLKSGRFLNWYGFVFAFIAASHAAGLFSESPPAEEQAKPDVPLRPWSFRYTLLTGLAVWITFALSPLGGAILSGQVRDPDHLFSPRTPRQLTQYLRENPPVNPIFNPQTYGDWILWDGPPNVQPFITTNTVHVLAPRIYQDYLRIHHGTGQTNATLKKYGIRTVIVNRIDQAALLDRMGHNPNWSPIYEDGLCVVFRQK